MFQMKLLHGAECFRYKDESRSFVDVFKRAQSIVMRVWDFKNEAEFRFVAKSNAKVWVFLIYLYFPPNCNLLKIVVQKTKK